MSDTGLLSSSSCCAGWGGLNAVPPIAGRGTGGPSPAWIQLSHLSLSLLGTGPPDAGPVIQEHHPLWALKLHTQLPPSKHAGRRGGMQLCSSGGGLGWPQLVLSAAQHLVALG